MPGYEMPVLMRFSKKELAAALGRPEDDPDVQQLDGLNVVLRTAEETGEIVTHPSVVGTPGAEEALRELRAALAPLEERLFAALRSSPATASAFVTSPVQTLEKLGLLDDGTKEVIERCARTLAPLQPAE